jgi:hypothetical protein
MVISRRSDCHACRVNCQARLPQGDPRALGSLVIVIEASGDCLRVLDRLEDQHLSTDEFGQVTRSTPP